VLLYNINQEESEMKAHELLNDASKWTKEVFARDAEGKECPPEDDAATCFCILGAVRRCYRNFEECLAKIDMICMNFGKPYDNLNATNWNDHEDRTFEDVRNLLLELDI
jgi:hypothetical protein